MIYQGNALEVLKKLPDESVNMCITSPPYWALRDYGVEGQLGLEPTFQEYINKLCDIFDEVKRVLRKDGTCWVNMGDTYNSTPIGRQVDPKRLSANGDFSYDHKKNVAKDLPMKTLLQIPSRFAIEMTNRGWILRNEIIWFKPNCMPSSVKDRFTVDFEKIFFFSKNKKYYFEQQLEDSIDKESYSGRRKRYAGSMSKVDKKNYAMAGSINEDGSLGEVGKKYPKRNKRCVWKITTKPFKGAHFAVYPPDLIETPIKAGCPKGGIVLDPFFGAGTTGIVAKQQGKDFIGIELNPEYIKIAEQRIKNTQKSLF